MDAEHFDVIAESIFERCHVTNVTKRESYTGRTQGSDVLGNFKRSAERQGITTKEALRGFLDKHITALYDYIGLEVSACYYDITDWQEKITDIINYMVILEAILEEEKNGN